MLMRDLFPELTVFLERNLRWEGYSALAEQVATLSIVDRAYLIFEGKVVTQGTKEFLINDPIARRVYLGEGFQM